MRRPGKFSILALLVVVFWLAVGGVAGPMAGKLTEVQSNSSEGFLPDSSETTTVSTRLKAFDKQGGETILPMTIVFERESGFSATDEPEFQALVTKIIAMPDVKSLLATVNVPGVGEVPSVFPSPLVPGQFAQAISQDGSALVININLDFKKLSGDQGAFKKIGAIASDVQALVDEPTAGTTGYVTGSVGIFAEFAAAFAGIDGILLLITIGAVALILMLVYRSPILWIIPLMSALFALSTASGLVYLLAKNDVIKLNGQSQGILLILVMGAATDYALLMVSRYREELRAHENKWESIRNAWKGVWEPIAASAGTVIAGLMCLELSELRSNAGLGPVGAIGVASALLVNLTFLPAVLGLVGRKVFWPFVPKFGSAVAEHHGIWGKVAALVGKRPRWSWAVSTVILVIMAWGVGTLNANGISTVDSFVNQDTKPLVGLRVLQEHGLVPPTVDATIVMKAESLNDVADVAKSVDGIAAVTPRASFDTGLPVPLVADGWSVLDVTFDAMESSVDQQRVLGELRDAVHAVPGAEALVGGSMGAEYDVQQSSRHDRNLIIPVILAVITLILMALLRSVFAPLLLLGTVVLSFGASLGASAFVFNHVFGFPGTDTSYPLFAFVFLVALGIDYNIFLMTRVREESQKLGTRAGTLKALTVTGGVITSAGVVLAATFAALGILPLVFMAEIGFTVAFGVLLDTLLVRSILVPALAYDLGQKIWWPSKLSKVDETAFEGEKELTA